MRHRADGTAHRFLALEGVLLDGLGQLAVGLAQPVPASSAHSLLPTVRTCQLSSQFHRRRSPRIQAAEAWRQKAR